MIQGIHSQAVVYCRVSSAKQMRVGDGIHSQETRCREYARMKGYEVVEVFKDDALGSLINRPGMKAMLSFLTRRRSKNLIVIIDDISRLARGIQQHIELRGAIAKAGGNLESPSIEFGEDSDSVLVENLLASVSQHQRQKNGEQTKNRMRARVMNGYWPFQAPIGYKYRRVTGRGQMLMRDEPVASIIQEVFEGYACGRYETQADVMRALQDDPLFPKDRQGQVRNQRVSILLRNPIYAGYVEAPKWDVSLRVGQHEPLISFETFKRVQDRLNGGGYSPRRKNLNEDFPLRGWVLCHDCGTPLTACWSKGSHSVHPYYLCPKRGCDSYGKSIRRDRIEGEFEDLLRSVQPTDTLFRVARMMFKDAWDLRIASGQQQAKALQAQLIKVEREADALVKRVVETSVPSVIAAYEDKLGRLEEEKLLLNERIASAGRPAKSFEETLRTALSFLSSPWNIWSSGHLEKRRTVLKLAFADRLRYARNEGFRTANLSLPFKVLDQFCGAENMMARPKGFEPLTPRFVVLASLRSARCAIQLSSCEYRQIIT